MKEKKNKVKKICGVKKTKDSDATKAKKNNWVFNNWF